MDGQKFPPVMASYIAVKVYGPGHVIAYNYVANFHDGIDTETYGNPDGSAAVDGPKYPPREYLRPAAGRDRLLQQLHDQLPRQPVRGGRQHAQRARDAEHDDQLRLARVLQSAGDRRAGLLDPQHRLSPAGRLDAADRRLGGRDVLQQHHPVGDAGAGRVERALAQQPVSRRELGARDLRVNTYTNYTSSDYNGFRPNPGAPYSFAWNSPPWATAADYSPLLRGRGAGPAPAHRRSRRVSSTTLEEYSRATHQDQHSVLVDYDVFVNVPRLDAQDVATVQKVYKAESFDFRLKPGSAAVDRGMTLPNVTDGFAGAAPDLGALEVGQPAPHYGPRDSSWLTHEPVS